MEKGTLGRLVDVLARVGFEIVSLKEHRERVRSGDNQGGPEKTVSSGFIELGINRLDKAHG
jgi:hypothetical protein